MAAISKESLIMIEERYNELQSRCLEMSEAIVEASEEGRVDDYDRLTIKRDTVSGQIAGMDFILKQFGYEMVFCPELGGKSKIFQNTMKSFRMVLPEK